MISGGLVKESSSMSQTKFVSTYKLNIIRISKVVESSADTLPFFLLVSRLIRRQFLDDTKNVLMTPSFLFSALLKPYFPPPVISSVSVHFLTSLQKLDYT